MIRVFLHDDTLHKLEGFHASWTFLVLQQQQNLKRRFGASKLHISPTPPPLPTPRWLRLLSVLRRWFCCCWLLFIVTPFVGVCNCSMFCCRLLYVHSSFAIILMRKGELIALLCLSSWCLVMVVWLFLAEPWVCLRLWLWYFLIILTYYFRRKIKYITLLTFIMCMPCADPENSARDPDNVFCIFFISVNKVFHRWP